MGPRCVGLWWCKGHCGAVCADESRMSHHRLIRKFATLCRQIWKFATQSLESHTFGMADGVDDARRMSTMMRMDAVLLQDYGNLV